MNSSTRARALTLDLPLPAIEPVLKEWATFFWEDRTPALVYQSLSETSRFQRPLLETGNPPGELVGSDDEFVQIPCHNMPIVP